MTYAPYDPHGAALAMWRSKAPEVLIPGPAGTGKTRAVLEKAIVAAMKYPGARVLLVRKTRASMTESVLVTFESHVAIGPEGRLPWVGEMQRATRRAYELPNGSVIVAAGMDNVDRIMSAEYDLICVFEATELTEHDWETLSTRLRNGRMPYQQIIADCNPTTPTHWLKRRADAGRMDSFPSRHEDNPRLWDGTKWTDEGTRYLDRLGRLTGHRRERLLFGRWAAAEGLVYPDWSEAVHLLDAMPDGWRGWAKYRAIDFGFTNPFVCQWWARDPDGRAYLYREIYRTGRTVADHARQITTLSLGEEYVATVADHDAEDRATLLAAGIQTLPANKAVTVGIQRVSERLRVAGDGKPRLFVLRSALVDVDETLREAGKPYSTAQEFDSYVWPKGADGKSLKEEPVKEYDHGLDAARYLVAHFDASAGLGAMGGLASVPKSVPTHSVATPNGVVSGAMGGIAGGRWGRDTWRAV